MQRIRRDRLCLAISATLALVWFALQKPTISYEWQEFKRTAHTAAINRADRNYATRMLGYYENKHGWWRSGCTITVDDDCRIGEWPRGKGRQGVETFLVGIGAAITSEYGMTLLLQLLCAPLLLAAAVVYGAPRFWRWLAP